MCDNFLEFRFPMGMVFAPLWGYDFRFGVGVQLESLWLEPVFVVPAESFACHLGVHGTEPC